ncbi:MAG: hypothetical protein ACMUHB_06770 [Thermoplasmatota archaeon]
MEEKRYLVILSIIFIILIAFTALVLYLHHSSEEENYRMVDHILLDQNSMEIDYAEEGPRVMEPIVFSIRGAPPNSTIIWDFGESDSRLFGEVLTYRFNTSAHHFVKAEVRLDGSRIALNTTVPVKNRDQHYLTSDERVEEFDHFRFGPELAQGISYPGVIANASIGEVQGSLRVGVYLMKGRPGDSIEIPLREQFLVGPLSLVHLEWNISGEEISAHWDLLPFRAVILIETLDAEEVSRGKDIECSIEVIY